MTADRTRVVVVGCGGMANRWVDVTLNTPELELVGLVDKVRSAAEAKAEQFNLPGSLVYDTLADAIREAKPEVVFDVTIPAAHHAVTVEALRAGCHVLGEKPMAETLEQAREMVAAAKAAGKLYAVTQTRRPLSTVVSIAQFLAKGGIGQIEEVHCDFYLGPHFGGFRDEMAHPLLLDMAIHTFDSARQISGADPKSVYCHAFNPPHSWYRGDASAVAIFDMVGPRDEPIVYSYRGSWCAQGLQTSWQAQWRIIGSEGTLMWDGEQDIRAQVLKPEGKREFFYEMQDVEVPRVTLPDEGHAYLIREFARCVREGGTPMCPCEDNIKSLAMVLAAVKSAESGQRVDVAW